MAHGGDSGALAFIGMAAALELVIGALDKMKASAKAADEALAMSLESAGSRGAIDAQKKAWEDADLAQDKYTYKPVATDEYFAARKEKTASGNLAKHESLLGIYGGNITSAKAAAKASGVTDEDAQDVQNAYLRMGGKPGADLGAMADFVVKNIGMDTTGDLVGNAHLVNMFSLAYGGRGLNDASFSAYALAQGDLSRNQGQLNSESAKDYSLRQAAQRAAEDLEASRKAGAGPTGFGTSSEPGSGRTPYRQTAEGQARFDFNQLEGAHDILGHGGALSAQQSQMIQQILTAATGHAVRNDKILEALQTLLANQRSQDAAFGALLAQVKQRPVN